MSYELSNLSIEGDLRPRAPMPESAYQGAREILDRLPAGVYVKCSGCSGWWQGTPDILMVHVRGEVVQWLCESCGVEREWKQPWFFDSYKDDVLPLPLAERMGIIKEV